MKKLYTAMLLVLLAAMFSVGVYSLADYDATGSVSEKREFVKPEFSVKALLDGTFIPALEQYYSDTFPGRESLLKANRTLNKFYYYSGSGEDSVLILNQTDSAAQGGESLGAVQKANGQTPQPEQPAPAQPEATPEPQPDTTTEPADQTDSAQTPEPSEEQPEQQPEADPELDTPEESDASYAGSVVVVGDRAMEIPTRLDDLITSYAGAVENLSNAMGPDVRTISLITPNGGEFYSPESLHTGEHSQKDMIDFCYSQMNDKIVTVDAYSKLRSHTDEYIYFRTDHHWTTYGAYYGYREYLKSVGKTPKSIDDFKFNEAEDFFGTQYSKAKSYNRKADVLSYVDCDAQITINDETDSIYDYSCLDTRDKYKMFLRGNYGFSSVKGSGKGKLLVVKDSYANCLIPYLTGDYEQIDIYDLRYITEGLDKRIEEEDYDEILFLYNCESLLTDSNLPKINLFN